MREAFLVFLLAVQGAAAEVSVSTEALKEASRSEVARSTAAARAASAADMERSPFNLDFLYTPRGAAVQFNYRLRWDFGDLPQVPSLVGGVLRSPVRAFLGTTRGITRSARLRVYGLSIKPSKLIVYEDSERSGGRRAAGAPGEPEGVSERRARLSLTPVLQDIRESLPGDIRREAFNQAFNSALPQGRSLSYGEKRAVYEDILQVDDVWGLPVIVKPIESAFGGPSEKRPQPLAPPTTAAAPAPGFAAP